MSYSPPNPDLDPQPEQRFEDLTLAEALAALVHTPRQTFQALREVLTSARRSGGPVVETSVDRVVRPVPVEPVRPVVQIDQRAAVQLGLRLAAFVMAWWGTAILANTPQRTEETALVAGLPFLVGGVLLWLGSELYIDWPKLRQRKPDETEEAPVVEAAEAEVAEPQERSVSPQRVVPTWLALGLLLCVTAWYFTTNNKFTLIGFLAWALSIGLWTWMLSPVDHGPRVWLRELVSSLRGIRWRSAPTIALLAVLLLGAAFRFSNLEFVPPEMTSDHVELILDSFGVQNGRYNVFFANNGGRESLQMYTMALFSELPGLGMNYYTLKLLTVIEGMIAIVLMYWMGRELIGSDNRRLGTWVGLCLAALVAASYWHTVLSRLGLRIVLTTIIVPLLLVFLARAMRFNRREDFIKAGLVLGFGLYTYQAVRMLPVVIMIGVGIALLFKAHTGRERERYALNFLALVLIAVVVFVPMLGYSIQYPEDFWRRTSGRLLGDDIITVTQPDGTITSRNATIQERIDAFKENVPIIFNNMRNALLMFQWKGDVAWINGAPNEPTMDTISGALMILGMGAWLARMFRRRDVFDWLLPVALVIMLLPSALSIAYPVENPSHTRTSGALPEAYLIAALPLALIGESIVRLSQNRRGQMIAVGLASLAVMGSYTLNTHTYFVDHVDAYIDSSLPYSEAGRILRGFAQSIGSYGNVYMIAYPYWWDHRALGIEAGHPDWPNGVISIDRLRDMMRSAYERDDQFRYLPDHDLLFFYSVDDAETAETLQRWFPQGHAMQRQSYQWDDQYMLYEVPALGDAAFRDWLLNES